MMFDPNETERGRSYDFWEKHHKKCRTNTIKVIITHGEIGTSMKVKCPKCKKTKNITDYKMW